MPDGGWNQLAVPGSDLLWRSTHVWAWGLDPTVTQLEIDWLYAYSVIDSIWDVPNDQGRQASIMWKRSGYDYPGSPVPITEYSIYRKIDYDLSSLAGSVTKGPVGSDTGKDRDALVLMYPPGDWHFVMTVPAYCEDTYSAVVPTLADSTIIEGMYYSVFFVRAGTGVPSAYFDSPPDSGYSVDNIAPGVPEGFAVTYNTGSGNELTWEECPDEDFQYFCVYRGEEEYELSPETLVKMTAAASWTDPVEDGWLYSYKVTAVDCNGNESAAASPGTVTGDDLPRIPNAFALYQNVPNPFNPTTTIRFDLPRSVHVKLCVYNVKGELISTLVDQRMTEGRKEITWTAKDNRGRAVSSGIYFCRLIAGDFVLTKKMVLLR
jgi:hypothetical protein